ncbi:hypothetical protein CKO17_14005 [Marichromatium gracile]|nr:hypothetical protein [Marichromatium gracile]
MRWRADLRAPVVIALGAFLALQLLLALILGLGGAGVGAPAPSGAALFDLDPEAVARVTIAGPDDSEPLVLERGEDGWTLASLGGVPVRAGQVARLLDTLGALRRTPPIATSDAALARFRVADDAFERRLVLADQAGEPLATLYAGDSPGYRRLFARPAGETAVLDLPLALADLSNRAEDWIDTGLLRVEPEQITAIAGDGWRVARDGEGWQLEGATEGRSADQHAIDTLVRSVANLGYRTLLDAGAESGLDQPVLELDLSLETGTRHYRIGALDDGDYALQSDHLPHVFRLSRYDLGELLDLEADDLTVAPEAPTPAEEPASPAAPDSAPPETPAETISTEPASSPAQPD